MVLRREANMRTLIRNHCNSGSLRKSLGWIGNIADAVVIKVQGLHVNNT